MSLRGNECSIQHINHLHTAHIVNLYVVIAIIMLSVTLALVLTRSPRRAYSL